MLAVPSTPTTAEPKQQQAKAEHHGSGASNRELLLQGGHDFQTGYQLLLLGKSNSHAGWPRERAAQAMRWHQQPCGKEEDSPCTSVMLCVGQGGHSSPWAESCRQLAWGEQCSTARHRGEAGDLGREPSACLRGCKCFACLPRPDTVTVRQGLRGPGGGLPETRPLLMSLLPTSPSLSLPW